VSASRLIPSLPQRRASTRRHQEALGTSLVCALRSSCRTFEVIPVERSAENSAACSGEGRGRSTHAQNRPNMRRLWRTNPTCDTVGSSARVPSLHTRRVVPKPLMPTRALVLVFMEASGIRSMSSTGCIVEAEAEPAAAGRTSPTQRRVIDLVEIQLAVGRIRNLILPKGGRSRRSAHRQPAWSLARKQSEQSIPPCIRMAARTPDAIGMSWGPPSSSSTNKPQRRAIRI
jgi:hypothetical protein